ncbi:MAG: recombinase family protein [Limisphaerales bacterium]|jgi:DNA invertase Pin-like site-specific DNA recombinase
MTNNSKVTAEHLKRIAYLYVRQSTLRQVFENTESTHRQYDLRQRAIALGWPEERIEVIDCDQAHSGQSAVERDGFQYLVSQVGLGRAGLVMGLEVSRLARNCADWHQLMQICGLTNALILDQDGLYDPSDFNDRLVLGLKATMSEAELHILKSRLHRGIVSKAQRGELKMRLPIGLVYDPAERVVLDPDRQVQEAIRHFFDTFRRCGSAWSTVAIFRQEGLKFPRHRNDGSGELIWEKLRHGLAMKTLRNPLYAGAFCYGRWRTWKDGHGRLHRATVPQEQWQVLIKEAHPGYISWEVFQENQERLRQNRQAPIQQRRSPPREGPALLQGLALCGVCGRRLTVRYYQHGEQLVPEYLCQKASVEDAQPICQHISGGVVDEAVGKLIIESVSPLALEVSLQVQQELQSRLAQADRLRRQEVERAQYEANQAQVRFMRVDPNNRLVADTLEGLWNEKLRQLAQAKEDYEKKRQADQQALTQEQKQDILALAQDFPKLWNDPKTSHRDRKRMAGLLVEDVTLKREATTITAQVRFKGGAGKVLTLPAPLTVGELRRTRPEIVAEIDQLLDSLTPSEIAARLNQQGWRGPVNHKPFTARSVMILQWNYKLTSRADRLRAQGLLDIRQMAQILGTKPNLVDHWRERGLLRGARLNEKKEYLYEHPDAQTVQTIQRRTRLNRIQALS